eukprot:680-Heterococcus_DN1.PRE.2
MKALLLLLAPVILILAAPFDWTYNEDSEPQLLPPSQWHKKHQACSGMSQSPIMLSKSNTTPCWRRQEAFIFYGGDCTLANVVSKPLPSNWGYASEELHTASLLDGTFNCAIMLCIGRMLCGTSPQNMSISPTTWMYLCLVLIACWEEALQLPAATHAQLC